ncbi:MAG: nucleoside-diphosphate sugar epimerase/dehydratase [Myxococcota bacterium]
MTSPAPPVGSSTLPAAGTRPAVRGRWLRGAVDVVALILAGLGAYCVRFEGWPPDAYAAQLTVVVPAVVALRLGLSRALGLRRVRWQLFGLREALLLARAVGVGTGVLLAWRLVAPTLTPGWVLPLGVIVLEGLFSLVAVAGVRIAVRWWDEERERRHAVSQRSSAPVRALLVGAGRAGQQAARALRSRPDAGYEVVGFIDDEVGDGVVIEGLPVLGTTRDAAALAARVQAEAFILTMHTASRAERRRAAERCGETGFPVCTVPSMFEVVTGRVGISAIRPLRVEDLLGRDAQRFDSAGWARMQAALGGRAVLVTGAGGSIGRETCRQLLRLGVRELVMVDHHENSLFEIEAELRAEGSAVGLEARLLDVRDAAGMAALLREHPVSIVFHAAAFKHVPMMEQHPAEAIDNNVGGTRVVLEAAEAAGVERFVLVSTDKAVAPRSVMGASKRVAELLVQARGRGADICACSVRFGNVLGSQGSVVHTFRRQIERGGPVTVTHPDATRYFMTIPEAVRLVIQAAVAAEGGEVFMLDMGEPVRILELARQMIRLSGRTEDEVPIEISQLRRGEKLHEALVCPGEGIEPTAVEGILRARPAAVDALELGPWVERLEAAAAGGQLDAIARMLTAGTGYEPDPRTSREPPPADDDAGVLAAG